MLLMADIGNTTINIGVWDGGEAIKNARFPTKRHNTPDAHAITLLDALSLMFGGRTRTPDITGAVIASVVPAATNAVAVAVSKLFGISAVIVGAGTKTGDGVKIDDPALFGADLVATAVGAAALYKPPMLVYDLGTATKISVIARDGQFMGGMIYPGVGISLGALGEKASLLPALAIDKPPVSAVTRNTADAMQAGILYGTAGALDGMAARIEEETNETYNIIATGGYSAHIVPLLRKSAVLREELIFDGMKAIYEMNGGSL